MESRGVRRGILKKNHEVIQYGPWIRANSPIRRKEKTQERHAGHPKTTRSRLEKWPRREDYDGRRDRNQRRRTTNSSEEEQVRAGG